MALTATTLSAACGMSDLTLAVTSSTGFAAGQPVKIDNEYMVCVSVPSTTSIVVRSRGNEGTIAIAHDILANVETSASVTDFPGVPLANSTLIPPHVPVLLTLGQNQTLTLPLQDTTYIIDKASAATITLPTPSKAQDGLRLTFTSQTAAAHVVSGSSLIADGVSGSPHSTCTFAAFKGVTLNLLVDQGLYNLQSQTGITVT